jgi:predicted metal-dependent hydrolase
MSETLQIGELTFEVRRSPRRRTLGLTVDRSGELVIHSPEATTPPELEKWARSKLLWVHRKLALKEEWGEKFNALAIENERLKTEMLGHERLKKYSAS